MKKPIHKSLRELLVAVVIRIMGVRVFGKHLFVNRYTKKIPGFSKLVKIFELKTLANHIKHEREVDYKNWLKHNIPNEKELINQRKLQKTLKKRPLISIIVPTYNTEPKHLRACIESVISQTYQNWELCIADDASKSSEVVEVIQQAAAEDSRIKYTVRKQNGHICKASNSALKLAKGEFVALLDHDDVLWPNALFEVVSALNKNPSADFIYTDEDKIDESGKHHMDPFFKPDWSPEFLRSINYITHFAVIKKSLVSKAGNFRPGFEGAQDWDLFLRISRLTNNIVHVPKVVYSWRKSSNSTAQVQTVKNYAYVSQEKALKDDIEARGLSAKLSWQIPMFMWRVDYELQKEALVSIVIPTKNQIGFIRQCLDSLYKKTTYTNFEIIVVDTGSDDKAVWEYYEECKRTYGKLTIVNWNEQPFNFSSACNAGAEQAKGEYLLFLNNDTEVISETWIEDMLGYAEQEEIGIVGCKLYYPDRRLQHAGIILGVGGQNGTPGIAGHFFPAFVDEPPQDPAQPLYMGGARNFCAVTAACFMLSKEKFEAVGGFDPVFRIAFNDVDLCLKVHDHGWRNVFLPHVKLYHHESVSVGQPGSKQRDLDVFAREIQLMLKKWKTLIDDDPYYHPVFRRDVASARLRTVKSD